MSPEKNSQTAPTRPQLGRPEAIEFARSGRVDNRVTSFEQRERMLVQTVFVILICVVIFVAAVFSLV